MRKINFYLEKNYFWCIWCSCKNNFINIIYLFLIVENLVYKKEVWINGKNLKKRYVFLKIDWGYFDKVVDGKIDFDFYVCIILDNLYGDIFVWIVDFGVKILVLGIIIYIW